MHNGPDFEKIIEPFVELYQKIELNLIEHIASHFKLYEDIGFKNSMEWYAKKAEELGSLNQEAIQIISEATNIPKKKIIKMLKEASISLIDNELIDKLNNTGKYNIDVDTLMNSTSFLNVVNNSYKEVNGIFKLINTKALEGASQAYMEVLNEAYISVKSGVFDYNTSIRKALEQLANQGITVASYKQKNGKILQYGLESCVRRDVMTAVVQCTNKSSECFASEMGAEHYEVSQHLGARVTNTYDYKDHSWWQGKVYKINGSDSEYPNFQETVKEGDVQGLGGANCRHIKWGFFPGVSVPKNIEISPEENQRIYEMNQTKRAYERKIRKLKRSTNISKASNDKENYQKYRKKLKVVDTEYNQFLKNNNLKRQFNREQEIKDRKIFNDEFFQEFEKLDNKREYLIYYDYQTGAQIGNIIKGETHRVALDTKMKVRLLFAKKDSLLAVHNHPSNFSFSLTDFQTFNNSVELKAIAVRTDKYIYLLSTGKGSKIKATMQNMKLMEKKFKTIEQKMGINKQNKTIDIVHLRNKYFAKEMGWKYGRIENKK